MVYNKEFNLAPPTDDDLYFLFEDIFLHYRLLNDLLTDALEGFLVVINCNFICNFVTDWMDNFLRNLHFYCKFILFIDN